MAAVPAAAGASPLAGFRVLDFTRVLAGPLCTMQLGDLGAEVIKVEHPRQGDDTRGWKPPEAGGEGFYYLAFNRGKQGITLDVASAEGRAVALEIADKVDIVVENFRPGVMKRLGLDYPTLSKRNPGLIYCALSAYGQTGPMSERPGYDPVIQAEFGMMSITGEIDGAPLRTNVPVIDTVAALYGTIGILSAVVARGRSGRGQLVDVSLMGAGLAVLGNNSQFYLLSGENPPRMGNAHPNAVPAGLYYTRNGPVYLALSNDKLFDIFCRDIIGQPALLEDERFNKLAGRIRNADAVRRRLQDALTDVDRDDLLARMRQAGLPAGAVRSVGEALDSPEVAAAGLVVTVDHPTAGPLRMVGSPLKLSETGIAAPTPPPRHGEHTDSVLEGLLGYDAARVAALRQAGIIA